MGSLRSSAQAHDLGHLANEFLAANRNQSSRGADERPSQRFGAQVVQIQEAADSGSPRNPWVSWGWEHRGTCIRAIRTRGAQKLACGSPLAGNGAREMGRMSAKDPEGRSAAPLGLDRPIRLAQGRGEYLADRRPEGLLEVAFVRSPFAHARVGTITGAGVTAADLALNELPAAGGGSSERSWPALARDRARFAGEAVAAVWAEDRYLAEDLADQVVVEWEPLDLEPPEIVFEHELV